MRRPMVFVLLAGLAAMLASVMVYSALKSREAEVEQARAHNVQVVVAAYDLPLGTKIDLGEVKLTRWSADSIPDGAYTDPKQVIGSFVRNSLVANEPVVRSKLFSGDKTAGVMPLLIPFGMRAVSVPVDEVSDVAGFVLPHSRVDVLVSTQSEATGKAFSKVVLQNVEVLAVAQEVEEQNDKPTVVKVVTLLVTPQEAERLALASRSGTLRLAMRNYNDNKIVLTNGTDVAQMLRAYSLAPDVPVMAAKPEEPHHEIAAPRRTKPVEIEILRNGKSSESVSFVNEAAAGGDGTKNSPGHSRKAAAQFDNNNDAGAAAASPPAESRTSDSNHVDLVAAPVNSDIAPAKAPINAAADHVPTPKTIDIP
ncbi:MAG: Flp pilus assembly protein CpaB [Candidatus Binatus sp.]|uniref:Flp pilus assembly protein CpaB n=1 Tax=Candidatus Binatus sp. TaxID=2811406 RepID=UPI003C74D021